MSIATFPVVEVFGPTLQGEGVLAGTRCSFVRFAFCDYKCPWCDTKYAHDKSAGPVCHKMMSAQSIACMLRDIQPDGLSPNHVTLTGGNPVMQPHCNRIFDALGSRTEWNVETQGSLWQDWLNHPYITSVTVSPKLHIGPGIKEVQDWASKVDFPYQRLNVKIVAFNAADVHAVVPYYNALVNHCASFTIQSGTEPSDTREDVLDRYEAVTNYVLQNVSLLRVRVLPQMHVLLWKHATGV